MKKTTTPWRWKWLRHRPLRYAYLIVLFPIYVGIMAILGAIDGVQDWYTNWKMQ